MLRIIQTASGLFVYLAFICAPVPVNAQSTVVSLPSFAPAAEGAHSMNRGSVPNSLSRQLLKVESLLAAPTPSAWRNKLEARQLLQLMNSAGLHVVLDESAADNGLDGTTTVRLALRNASIDTNLRFALLPFQCNYVISDAGVIRIMSQDAMLDYGAMTITNYDISRLTADYDGAQGVMDLLANTIDPDSWADQGGLGQMQITATKNGFLLTVTHTYQQQRQIRELLAATYSLGGGAATENESLLYFDGTSHAVLLPEEYLALRRNRRGISLPGSGTTSGFGGGGAIRGGGVF